MRDSLKEIFDELLALHGEIEDENVKLTAEVERYREALEKIKKFSVTYKDLCRKALEGEVDE